MFPGVDPIGITLPINFWIPIWREILLSAGLANSDAESIRSRIITGDPGTAMVIVVGGQREFQVYNNAI